MAQSMARRSRPTSRRCSRPLKPGDLVIMDNLGSHKGGAIRRAIRAACAKLLFLPKYSPDLNPIEQVFDHRQRRKVGLGATGLGLRKYRQGQPLENKQFREIVRFRASIISRTCAPSAGFRPALSRPLFESGFLRKKKLKRAGKSHEIIEARDSLRAHGQVTQPAGELQKRGPRDKSKKCSNDSEIGTMFISAVIGKVRPVPFGSERGKG